MPARRSLLRRLPCWWHPLRCRMLTTGRRWQPPGSRRPWNLPRWPWLARRHCWCPRRWRRPLQTQCRRRFDCRYKLRKHRMMPARRHRKPLPPLPSQPWTRCACRERSKFLRLQPRCLEVHCKQCGKTYSFVTSDGCQFSRGLTGVAHLVAGGAASWSAPYW